MDSIRNITSKIKYTVKTVWFGGNEQNIFALFFPT